LPRPMAGCAPRTIRAVYALMLVAMPFGVLRHPPAVFAGPTPATAPVFSCTPGSSKSLIAVRYVHPIGGLPVVVVEGLGFRQ
jgi:hypothetical protein